MAVYFRRGQSYAAWVPTIASTSSGPTTTELAAGTEITQAVTALSGFETSLNRINTPLMSQKEELQVDGPQTLGDATVTIIDDDGVVSAGSTARAAARTALAESAVGYLVIAPSKAGTPVATDKVDVWAAKVGARNRDLALDANLARTIVQLAITATPRKDVAVS